MEVCKHDGSHVDICKLYRILKHTWTEFQPGQKVPHPEARGLSFNQVKKKSADDFKKYVFLYRM